MNCLICEGPNDRIFLKNLFQQKINNDPHIIYNTRILKDNLTVEYKPNTPCLITTLNVYSEFFKSQNIKWILFENGGKDDLKKYVVPRIVVDTIHSIEKHKFLILFDCDYIDISITYQSVVGKLESHINNIEWIKYEPNGENGFIAYNEEDQRFYKEYHIMCVTRSLEKELVCHYLDNYNHLSRAMTEKLRQADPHYALEVIYTSLEISKEDFIARSVTDNWFVQKDWYNNLYQTLTEWTIAI